MPILEFINNNFDSICTFISTIYSVFGYYKDNKYTSPKYSSKAVISTKNKSDNSKNKQIKPTFIFFQVNINTK